MKTFSNFLNTAVKNSDVKGPQVSYVNEDPDPINPSRPNPGRREKTKLNFYFHTSLWCFKRFYEGLKGFHKTF